MSTIFRDLTVFFLPSTISNIVLFYGPPLSSEVLSSHFLFIPNPSEPIGKKIAITYSNNEREREGRGRRKREKKKRKEGAREGERGKEERERRRSKRDTH